MPLWMVLVIVVRDITITLLRSYQELNGKTMKTSFAAKTKTFIQMTYIFLIVILVCIGSFNVDSILKNSITDFLYSKLNYYLILLVTLLTLYTGVTYFFEKQKTISNPAGNN
jgi:CDP-diacylglycerol--glycerol-3-phosphate 3-phosphatidyltransferase